MGKKYLLEIEENKDGNFAWSNFAPYTEPDMEQVRKEAYDKGYDDATAEIGSDEQAIAEKAYQKGLSDAWECARKVTYASKYGGYGDCLDKVFDRHDGTDWDVFDYSASEALKEVLTYEQAQKEIRAKEIHAADVVQNKKDPYIKVFVTTVYNGKFSGVALTTVAGHCNRGNMFSYQDAERWEKVSGDWWRCLNEDDSE